MFKYHKNSIFKSCRNYGKIAKCGDESPKFETLLLLQPFFEIDSPFKLNFLQKSSFWAPQK